MKPVLALLALSFAGTSVAIWVLSGLVPWFLLPDLSFLAIVYAGLFLPGPSGLLAAVPAAFFREVTLGAPPGSVFLGSMALYCLAREIGIRIFFRSEVTILGVVCGLLAAESLSVLVLMGLAGESPLSVLWGSKEAVRIAWTSLLAVFLFMDLSSRWQAVRE